MILPKNVILFVDTLIDDETGISDEITEPIKNYVDCLKIADATKVSYISLVKKHIQEKYGMEFKNLAFPEKTAMLNGSGYYLPKKVKEIKKDTVEYIKNLKNSEDIYLTMLYYLLNSGLRLGELIRNTYIENDIYYVELSKKRQHTVSYPIKLIDNNADEMYNLYKKYLELNTNTRNLTSILNNRIKKIDGNICVKDLREIYTKTYNLEDDIPICKKISTLLNHTNDYISIHYNKLKII